MSSILKTQALINSIKTRGFIPESQRTFTSQQFLDIATEKINISLMKEIMTARGDYLIYFEDIPLQNDVSSYHIPDRAHGNKLRDCSIVDSNGNTRKELTQITLEELSEYNTSAYDSSIGYGSAEPFYIQNNKVILLSRSINSGDKIRMYFYMRPNQLVVETRAMTASSISQSVEIDNISPKNGTITSVSLAGEVTSTAHGLSNGQKIIISGSNSIPSTDGTYTISSGTANSFTIPVTLTTPGTVGSWVLATDVIISPSLNFPKHFASDLLYDIVTNKSPNNIKVYNIPANNVNNTIKTISFRVSDITKDNTVQLEKGNYITSSEETIVPNVPTEYHPVIAQMVAVHCMESMADEQQKRSAESTLESMKNDVLSITQNRVEGAPKKIRNRHGPLSQATTNRIRRGR
jgi:hypothetical protein